MEYPSSIPNVVIENVLEKFLKMITEKKWELGMFLELILAGTLSKFKMT